MLGGVFMLVENQFVDIEWNHINKKYYIEKGYVFTEYHDIFSVHAEDLLKSCRQKVKVICDCCGKEYEIPYVQYLTHFNKHGKCLCSSCTCKEVYNKKYLKMQQEITYSHLLKFCYQHSYKLLTKIDEIKNNRSAVKYICPFHGLYETKVTSMLNGKICYKCSRIMASTKRWEYSEKERKNTQYLSLLDAASKKGYELITKKEELKNIHDYILYCCPKHGIKKMRGANLISGRGCPDCKSENARIRYSLSIDEVKDRIEKCGGIILNPEDYINNFETNLQFECTECGNKFYSSLERFVQWGGQVCKNCSNAESSGERAIRHWLEDNNIEFEQEKMFPDCRDKSMLRFDFYLPKHNLIIEFDGSQHFRDTTYFEKSNYDYVSGHDKIKNDYCLEKGIDMMRIPFWNKHKINILLDEKINLHKDIV